MNSQQPTDHTPITPGMPPWVERNGFSDWAVAVLWIVLAFVLFQIVAGFVSVALIMIVGGTDPGVDFGDRLLQRMDLLFIGNSAGQILFLGFATYKVAGLHVWKDRVKTFLRFRIFPD
ncbi:MAG: CPBP family intramembrane glutamate endopeptidase, partial [Balneolaceae bacterium]